MRRFAVMNALRPPFRLPALVAFLMLSASTGTSAQWQRLHVGGMVNDSTTLPFNTRCMITRGDAIYVGGNAMGDRPGFYRSTNAGTTWTTPAGIGMGMIEIAALGMVRDTILAASAGNDSTTAALWASADQGASWQRLTTLYSDAAARAGDTVCVPRDMRCTDVGCSFTTSQGSIVSVVREKGAWKVARSKDPSISTVSMMDMASATFMRGDTTYRCTSTRDNDGRIWVELTTDRSTVTRRTQVSTTQQGAYVVCSLLMVVQDRVIAAVRDLTDLRGPDRIYVSTFNGGMAFEPLPPITSLHYGAKAIGASMVGGQLVVVFDAMGGVWKIPVR
ncbi:MAG: hypothetical protein JSS89_04565 [Bacteroidetes bacterium]|nr:hypothetical protein [Bacteroidota bacterium]